MLISLINITMQMANNMCVCVGCDCYRQLFEISIEIMSIVNLLVKAD